MREKFLHVHKKDFICFGILLCLIFVLKGQPVPEGNEFIYLPALKKQWNSRYLMNDWTYSSHSPIHFIFNVLFGLPSLVLNLETIGYLGRLSCWVITLITLFKIGRKFNLPRYLVTVSIGLWLLNGQSILAGSWIIGGFEAKCISHILFLFSVNAFLEKRRTLAGILLGVCFTFHPGVGSWAGLTMILAFIVLRHPLKEFTKFVAWIALFSLPGLIGGITLMDHEPASVVHWKYLGLLRMQHHMDPISFGRAKILLFYGLFMFNWLHSRQSTGDERINFFMAVEGILMVCFTAGLMFRAMENFRILALLPFRLPSVYITLFFYFHFISAWYNGSLVRVGKKTMVLGLFCLLSISNPLSQIVEQSKFTYGRWMQKEDDISNCFRWLARNTPVGSVLISPPWREDSFYLSERAQIVNWTAPRLERLKEWFERIETLVGRLEAENPVKVKETYDLMVKGYAKLSVEDLAHIKRKYGGDYFISEADLNLRKVYESGRWKVYNLANLR